MARFTNLGCSWRASPHPSFLGDKAYDANDIGRDLAADGSKAAIPAKANHKEPRPYDPDAYKMHNIIERSFNRAQGLARHPNALR